MTSFLAYITGFFVNFELLPILTDYANFKKGGMKLIKNLLLWNYWANLNQTLLKWFLDGPLPKLCPVIPTSNQDGRQALNRKKGDEILIVHCCFSVNQNELKF